MSPAIGSKAQIGFVEETVWASGSPTINKFIPFISESVVNEKDIVTTDAIRGGAARSVWREGSNKVGGDINAEVQPTDEFGTLFKHALGRAETAGPSGNGFYVHDIFPSGTLPAGLRLEIERDVGAFTYDGIKVNSVTLECSVGEPLTTTFSLLGRTETISAEPTTATSISTLNPLTFDEGATLIDGVDAEVSGFSLTINNNLKDDKGRLGSKYRAAIPRDGFRDVTGSLNMEFDNTTQYNKYVNGTEAAVSLTFTSDDVAISGQVYVLQIDCPRIVFSGTTPVVDGPSLIYHDMPFSALEQDSPDEDWMRYECRLRLINADSSI